MQINPSTSPETPPIDEGLYKRDLKKELPSLVDDFRTHLLANIIIINGTRLVLKKDSLPRTILFGIILWIVTYLIAYLLLALISYLILARFFTIHEVLFISPAAILLSFLTAFSFSIIKLLFDQIMPVGDSNNNERFPKNLINFSSEKTNLALICEWFRKFLSRRRQIRWSVATGAAGTLTIILFDWLTKVDYAWYSYVLVFVCFFAIGHGAYCAIVIPTLVRTINKADVQLFWLSPADTSWIRDASSIFTRLSLADAFTAAFCIFGLFFFAPLEILTTKVVALVWLIIGIVGLLYTFFYPHRFLKLAIKSEKKNQLAKLQSIITSYEERLKELSEDDLKRLKEYIGLHEKLVASRETALNVSKWLSLIPSLAVPTITFFVGAFGLWKQLIDSFSPVIKNWF